MADRIQATPQSPGLGALARALRGAQQFAERPFGYPNPPVAMLSELIGLPAVQRTVERMSYGEPLTTGRGMTLRPREDTTEAALAVLPMAPSALRGGLGAVKRATDLNAIRDYVRSAQGLSGLPGTAVVKPRGGNWLKGPGAPDDALQALKVRDRFGMTDPTELSAALGIPLEEAQALHASNAPNAAINQWIDQKLARYMRNEMGTPEDPLRELAERDILHYAPGEPSDTQKTRAALVRSREGYPAGGLGESDLARRWEVISDYPITPERAGDLMRLGEGSPTIRGNPWLAKVPPETSVYSIDASARYGDVPLGFNHLIDELRNATRAGSDLPRELQLRPEQLSKVSMPQAVELVDRINKWRAAQKAEADLARSTNAATQTFKEYPEQGYKWVELKAPEDVKVDRKAILGDEADNPYGPPEESLASEVRYRALEDALKYEGETMGHCVGGYCPDVMEGRSRIFSLRDAKGQPHVTVEVRPVKADENKAYLEFLRTDIGRSEFPAWLKQKIEINPDYQKTNAFTVANQFLAERGAPLLQVVTPPPEIVQIKGKGNRAPKDEYLPYVQDFVKSQRWGRVGDLSNTGLTKVGAEYLTAEELKPLVERASQFIEKTPALERHRQAQRAYEAFSGAVPSAEYTALQRAAGEAVHPDIPYTYRELRSILDDPGAYDDPGGNLNRIERLRELLGEQGAGYARGGMVSAAGGGPAQYDPARISALADQLLMEA